MFKVAGFRLDTRVKMSSALPDCRVNHSLVKFVPCRHNALTQYCIGKGHIITVIYEQIVCYKQNDKKSKFCIEITFISRSINTNLSKGVR